MFQGIPLTSKESFCKVNKSLTLDFSLGFFVVVVQDLSQDWGPPPLVTERTPGKASRSSDYL